MRKILIFLIVLMNVVSINYGEADSIETDNPYFYVFDVSHFGKIRYQYFVLSQQDNVLYDGYEAHHPPHAFLITNSILKVDIHSGTTTFTRFYDLLNEKTSPEYEGVIWETPDYVIYRLLEEDVHYIVVSTIFDNSYFVKYPYEPAAVDGRVESILQEVKSNSLRIEYLSTEDYEEKFLVITLPQSIKSDY